MVKMYEAEIRNYLSIIGNKDDRIIKLRETIKKALRMMKHPRLM